MKLTAIGDTNDIMLVLSEQEAFVVHWALSNYSGLIEYSLANKVVAHPWPDEEPPSHLTPRLLHRMVTHQAICQDIASSPERIVY